MKTFFRTILAVFLTLPAIASAQSQAPVQHLEPQSQPETEMVLPDWHIKTNLLYDATTTLNLGIEFRAGEKTSLDIPFNYNPWTFSNNRKLKHFLVQPELRFWNRRAFDGHFFGVHAHYAYFNVGNLPSGPFSGYMKAHRFEGQLAGIGGSYGYRWNFSHRWGLEATDGIGYAYLDYDKVECLACGARCGPETRNYFGPTKVGLSLIIGIGGKPASGPVAAPAPVQTAQPQPAPAAQVVVIYEPVFAASFITPDVEAVKARSESGKAYLDFPAGRANVFHIIHLKRQMRNANLIDSREPRCLHLVV